MTKKKNKTTSSNHSNPKNHSPTQAQQAVRDRFRAAARYAKALLQDADRKGYYIQQAQEKALPNAYVAAFTEYLRTTPAITITGNVKRALRLTSPHTQPLKIAETKPAVKHTAAARKPAKGNVKAVSKPAKRNVMAVCQIPGLSMAVACSGNVTAGKMKARKSRTGTITFTTSFYCH
jgi:hypothetical protein